MSAPFFYGEIGGWGGKMGLWIFLSWNCIFDWKYFPKSVNFTFSLPFLKVKLVMKWSFSRKYDGSAVNNWKTISCQVSTLAVQLDTLGLITPLHSQEWNKWFLVAFSIGPWEGWNLTIHKELPCFLSGEQHTPATGVNKCSNPDEGTLNEVSSLANEKFISSRNKYGAKGKAILVSVGVFSHQVGSPTRHSGVLDCT